ncbi:MAG: hypothetical protein Q8P90_01310 [bacterium]|nr:hypothetical protein [bacterium]
MNSIQILKKYIFSIVVLVSCVYALSVMWFLYSDLYMPLFLESNVSYNSQEYIINDEELLNFQTQLENKQKNRIDLSNITDPFTTNVDSITDEVSYDEDGLPTGPVLDN